MPEGKRAKATKEMVGDTNHKTVEKRKKRNIAEEDYHGKEKYEEEKEDEYAEEEQHNKKDSVDMDIIIFL